MDLSNDFLEKIDSKKIQINWNEYPIKMSEFLSFLTIKVERSLHHSGSSNGWTKLINKDYKLEIRGGIVNGVEYLDALQFGTNLGNRFNNYVNPFYLFKIMDDNGKHFFLKYYKEEIEEMKKDVSEAIEEIGQNLKSKKELKKQTIEAIKMLSFYKKNNP